MNITKLRPIHYIYLLLPLVVAAVVIFGISMRSNRIIIEGRIATCDDMTIYLERYGEQSEKLIDSIKLGNDGIFRFVISIKSDEPLFYDLVCGWEHVPLICKRGDRIDIDAAGSIALNYRVGGSEDSNLLKEFFQPYTKGSRELKAISSRYASAQYRDEQSQRELAKEYNDKYREIKQTQLRFISSNKESLASLYALTQRLLDDEYLIDQRSDLVYMQSVADGLSTKYPNSPYLAALQRDIVRLEKSIYNK